ncbi:tetratricopeptide repeat protein [Candidatus Peregrinibacteria bacterium]|jgi:tetratricopeptide (TPR) repeat protein|nr:tetratricopeptide repeat protein [Candidatus Peregrinibacteria bacterium]MBT5468524.1 tetratricopeptide repeat protein [Candidatus Peregrinibacteria bacterium]MBT7337754.1 tetratricopeptide repeat protein [Candidatus Peregrinibacteria bacterium]
MIYILVLFGSFFAICAILGMRVGLKNRNIRKFVHGVKARTEKAKERGLTMKETRIEKPVRGSRTSAVAMQKLRSLLREAEKTSARDDYAETERILIQALTVAPESHEARAELAKVYLLTGRDAKAEAVYIDLLQDRAEISFYANLGLACYRQKKYEQAYAAYKDAMNLDPKSPERGAALGRTCMALGRFSEAAELLEKASERLVRDTDLLFLIAKCYEALADLSSAEIAYKRIHTLQPYNELAREKLQGLASV